MDGSWLIGISDPAAWCSSSCRDACIRQVATPQIIMNYAAFLEEHAYFEVCAFAAVWGG